MAFVVFLARAKQGSLSLHGHYEKRPEKLDSENERTAVWLKGFLVWMVQHAILWLFTNWLYYKDILGISQRRYQDNIPGCVCAYDRTHPSYSRDWRSKSCSTDNSLSLSNIDKSRFVDEEGLQSANNREKQHIWPTKVRSRRTAAHCPDILPT